jgi:hypothetical protein
MAAGSSETVRSGIEKHFCGKHFLLLGRGLFFIINRLASGVLKIMFLKRHVLSEEIMYKEAVKCKFFFDTS